MKKILVFQLNLTPKIVHISNYSFIPPKSESLGYIPKDVMPW